MLLRSFQAIHVARAKFKEHVLKEHKEHRRLVRESAKMSDDDYEHAGPVDKTDEQIAQAQLQRQAWQDQMQSLKSELSKFFLHSQSMCTPARLLSARPITFLVPVEQ